MVRQQNNLIISLFVIFIALCVCGAYFLFKEPEEELTIYDIVQNNDYYIVDSEGEEVIEETPVSLWIQNGEWFKCPECGIETNYNGSVCPECGAVLVK